MKVGTENVENEETTCIKYHFPGVNLTVVLGCGDVMITGSLNFKNFSQGLR